MNYFLYRHLNHPLDNVYILYPEKSKIFFTLKSKFLLSLFSKKDSIESLKFNIYITSPLIPPSFSYYGIQSSYFFSSEDASLKNYYKYKSFKGASSTEQSITVLTTDEELIKNGVSRIENDFVEWFLDNITVKRVNVVNLGNNEWKPIIPYSP